MSWRTLFELTQLLTFFTFKSIFWRFFFYLPCRTSKTYIYAVNSTSLSQIVSSIASRITSKSVFSCVEVFLTHHTDEKIYLIVVADGFPQLVNFKLLRTIEKAQQTALVIRSFQTIFFLMTILPQIFCLVIFFLCLLIFRASHSNKGNISLVQGCPH